MPRYIDPNKIDFRLPYLTDTYGEALVPLSAVRAAIAQTPSEDVVALPCKVGDTIYLPWEWKDTSGVAILTVERMSITEAGCSIRTDLRSDDEDYWLAYNCGVFMFDDIGKTVFLTREEAEKALAERSAE